MLSRFIRVTGNFVSFASPFLYVILSECAKGVGAKNLKAITLPVRRVALLETRPFPSRTRPTITLRDHQTAVGILLPYFTVTLFARFLGLSIEQPLSFAI